MLIVRAFVNFEPIDELWIRRDGELLNPNNEYTYVICRPEKYNGLEIIHKYSDGWMTLVRKAIEAMEESNGIKRTDHKRPE
jgi:hypothetical protein